MAWNWYCSCKQFRMKIIYMLITVLLVYVISCNVPEDKVPPVSADSPVFDYPGGTVPSSGAAVSGTQASLLPSANVDTRNVSPAALVSYSKTLLGIPYKYASADPAEGFDCSGFITYTFNHFDIAVPRASVDFTHVGKEVIMNDARTGDLILFTGTDSLERTVGHMGIITENTDSLRFIHSSSGKIYGVTITALNNYYKGRLVKIIRVFS